MRVRRVVGVGRERMAKKLWSKRETLYIQNVARDFCLRRGRESKMRMW